MTRHSAGTPAILAVATGAALWLVTAAASGRREAWDASGYWTLAYPAALAACAALGYRYPARAWLWAVALFEGQFLAMCARNGELGGLWPLGMALFAVLSLPGVWAARFGARRRLEQPAQ
jgi:hypothetical protein